MTSFIRRHQITIVALALVLLSLHLALTDRRETSRGIVVKEVLSWAVSPLQHALIATRDAVTGVFEDYLALVSVKRENESLKNTLSEMESENNRLKEEAKLNERLRGLLEYKEKAPFETIVASVLAIDIDKWTRTAVINKGEEDGVVKDMAVITPLGVVGRVTQVNAGTSRVLLNTDLRSDIDVIVQRTRVTGVAEGNGTDGVILKYVRELDDVQAGDELVTSGFSGIFPKGLQVGEVRKIEKGRDNFFKHIEVAPRVDVNKLEDVLVVTNTGNPAAPR